MIACPGCGWVADVPKYAEPKVWAEHVRTQPWCRDEEPIRAYPSRYRASVCIKGHPRDALGICHTCTRQRLKHLVSGVPGPRARIKRRRRG